jgi:hypothetical protein
MKTILNIGAGKVNPNDFTDDYDFVVHMDRSYVRDRDPDQLHIMEDIEGDHVRVLSGSGPIIRFAPFDIWEFLDNYKYKFDHINADRIFEHQFYDSGEVGRLLDACNQITKDEGTLDIIVPDHLKLAKELVEAEENGYADKPYPFSYHCLRQSTEWMNTRCDPHGSVWTPLTAHYYIESEGGTWQIDNIEHDITHKGRDCYMKIACSKP